MGTEQRPAWSMLNRREGAGEGAGEGNRAQVAQACTGHGRGGEILF